MSTRFALYIDPFREHPPLDIRVLRVLQSLPNDVQEDFLSDETFRITLEDLKSDGGSRTFIELPKTSDTVSRCVVLRRRLAKASEEFARYIIAHELAHAFLRNGGWNQITDRELAADALAAAWGHHRPY